MKKIIFLVSVCSLFFCCRKNIEIDSNGVFIRGGINSEFVITKIINNNPNDTFLFPRNYYTKEKVRLQIQGDGISKHYKNGQIKYSVDGEIIDLMKTLYFQDKNQYYHWVKEKPIDDKKHKILPMKFENDHWYSIRDIYFKGSNYYFRFYINKNGEFEYDDIEHINSSPI